MMSGSIDDYQFDIAHDLELEKVMKADLSTEELQDINTITEYLEHSVDIFEAYNQYIIYYLDQISR